MAVAVPRRRRVRRRMVPLAAENVVRYTTPDNPWQALMECEVGSEPEWSRVELLCLRELLVDAVESLSPRHQWVFNATVIEARPMRTIAEELSLSLTMVHRLSHQARALLYEYLRDEPLLKEYLSR